MTDNQSSRRRLMSYLELVRLPNLFTAVADVAMGFLFVRAVSGPIDGWALGLLAVASSLLYSAGMVLNDVFDLGFDAGHRPDRPLPSGRVSLAAAKWLAVELLVLGVAAAWAAAALVGHIAPGVVAVALFACIVAYDAGLKQTPLGPPAMGACRMLNVLLGMSVGFAAWGAGHWLVAGGLGTYIAGVTWFARCEARESNRAQLALATVVLLLGIGILSRLPAWHDLLPGMERRWGLLMLILGALIGWRCLRAVAEPAPPMVQAAVKQCILSVVILDAAVCCAVRGIYPAVMILLLLVPAMFLGQWIKST